MQDIDSETYEIMQKLWEHFRCKDLVHFVDIYQKTDVILLAAVYENFRNLSISEFGLDPPHFHSAQGLTWAAALKVTNIEIDLLTDIDMIMFFEKGIRGGIPSVMKRCEKSNLPHTKDFDKSLPARSSRSVILRKFLRKR